MRFICVQFLFWLSFLSVSQECPVIPTPSVYEAGSLMYSVLGIFRVDAPGFSIRLNDYLRSNMVEFNWIDVEYDKEDPNMFFQQTDELEKGKYTIAIGNEEIVVRYSDEESCARAIASLLQLMAARDKQGGIPECYVEDEPRFQWRGLHLDVARHFFTVQEVKDFLHTMSLYKFNVFHWHLTDDQGWRIEIKKYPKLTSVGAYRDSTVIGHYSDDPRRYEHEHYGGFYTQEEIKEVVEYARRHFITVVPEIEMPGHSRAALAAYPELSCTGIEQEVPGLWGIFDDIYCSKKETIDFLRDVLSEVLELFPSEYIHIGGDEAPKTRWKECPNCQATIRKEKLKDEHELQSYFIRQMDAFLTERGRKLIGWDEILEGGLSPNAAVMSWRGEKGGIEAAHQQHNVVMTPTTYCYFDYYQSSHTQEPLAIGGYLPLEKVYAFDPVPKELGDAETKYILGGQANLWTEYIASQEHLEYMAYPRALALAQSLWCKEKPSYESFLNDYLVYQEDFLRYLGVNFAQSLHYPELQIERTEDGIAVGWKGASQKESFFVAREAAIFDPEWNDSLDQPEPGPGMSIWSELSEMSANDRISVKRRTIEDHVGMLWENSFQITSPLLRDTFYYQFQASGALGLPIDLLTEPHRKYNHNGSLNLVDGIRGSLPWKGSEWLGFNVPVIEWVVDLGEPQEVNGMSLGFLNNNGSWIYLPQSVEIFGSDDNIRWKKVHTEELEEAKAGVLDLDMFFKAETRYLKVRIKTMEKIPEGFDGAGYVPWTFVDELNLLFPWEWK